MLTVLQTAESLQSLVSKDRFLTQTDFALKMQSMFGSTYVCEITFSTVKQVRCKNTNRMAGETLDDSLSLVTTITHWH